MATKQKTLGEAAVTETSTGKKEKKQTQPAEIKQVELGTAKKEKSKVDDKSNNSKKKKVPSRKSKDKKENNNQVKKKILIRTILCSEKVITESSDEARSLNNQSCFGSFGDNGKIELSLLEGLYLMEKGKIEIKSEAGRKIKSRS